MPPISPQSNPQSPSERHPRQFAPLPKHPLPQRRRPGSDTKSYTYYKARQVTGVESRQLTERPDRPEWCELARRRDFARSPAFRRPANGMHLPVNRGNPDNDEWPEPLTVFRTPANALTFAPFRTGTRFRWAVERDATQFANSFRHPRGSPPGHDNKNQGRRLRLAVLFCPRSNPGRISLVR